MLIEFKVTRLDNKIVGIESNADHLADIKPELPLFTRNKIEVSKYIQPSDTAASFYRLVELQLKAQS
tara:strand:- start:176 stop:376 length:201 start_codon:yes stop_codon:yes gene_type:complete